MNSQQAQMLIQAGLALATGPLLLWTLGKQRPVQRVVSGVCLGLVVAAIVIIRFSPYGVVVIQ